MCLEKELPKENYVKYSPNEKGMEKTNRKKKNKIKIRLVFLLTLFINISTSFLLVLFFFPPLIRLPFLSGSVPCGDIRCKYTQLHTLQNKDLGWAKKETKNKS